MKQTNAIQVFTCNARFTWDRQSKKPVRQGNKEYKNRTGSSSWYIMSLVNLLLRKFSFLFSGYYFPR